MSSVGCTNESEGPAKGAFPVYFEQGKHSYIGRDSSKLVRPSYLLNYLFDGVKQGATWGSIMGR